jgi:iron complex outermembrane receptor protein
MSLKTTGTNFCSERFPSKAASAGTPGVAGASEQRDAYRPLDVPRFAYTYVVPGVFVQDDVSIASWLSVSASARADFHNRYGVFLSPRVSALLRWAGFTTRLSAGQGFFTPTPLTEETEAAGLSRLSLPAPLLAERGRSASIDPTRSLRSFSVTTTFFASNVSHPIFVDRGDAYRIINLPVPTWNRGAELLATWRKAPFSATASYTYVRSSELDPAAGRAEVPLTPRHSFGLVGMWEKEGTTRFGIECYYTGQQRLEYNPYRAWSSPYVIFGAMGERKVAAHVKLFLNLENLGNVRQSRWDSTLAKPRRGWTVDRRCVGAVRRQGHQRRCSVHVLERVLKLLSAYLCRAAAHRRATTGSAQALSRLDKC